MGRMVGAMVRAKCFVSRHTKARTFRQKCKNPLEAQWAYLKNLLEEHRDTDFGRKHEFGEINSIEDYRRKVPIRTWDELHPFMEAVWNGRHDALIPSHDAIHMYAESSGTTGKHKYIPVTEASCEDYTKTWDVCWSFVLKERPKTFYEKILYFPGDPEEGRIGDIPYGAISARAYLKQNAFIRSAYAYPYQVSKINDYNLRYYTIARAAVEDQVSFIPIANPSTILKLFNLIRDRREDIIDDIRQGRLRDADQLHPEVRAYLLKKIRPNPKRARELEEIYKRTGDFLPCDYWRKLSTILCFAAGPCKLYVQELRGLLDPEQVRIFDFGILASEGRFSLPISSAEEGCCPTIESNFFEFIPEDQLHSESPDVLTLDQLEVGKSYFIIITNASGLYRYNISDVVRVTGFFENTPLITFRNKGKHFSSVTGEKVAEFHVTESVRRACERLHRNLDDFVVCLHWNRAQPYYSLLTSSYESEDESNLEQFITAVEEVLMEINPEYRSKRKSLRLGPMTIKIVANHGYDAYENKRQQECHNLSQFKHIFLVGDPAFEQQFSFSRQIASKVGSRRG